MEKKFEQLDHFEKVVTYARQGYGGMTHHREGRHLARGPARGLVPGAQEVQRHQARAARRRHRPDLQRRIRRRVPGCSMPSRATASATRSSPTRPKTSSGGCSRCRWSRRSTSIGKQAKKVYVEFSHERLAALGITPLQIAESLRSQNSVLASGQIDTHGDRVLVRVSGQFASLDDIRNVPIAAGGRLIKLGDFTTVTRGYEDPPTYTVRHNGQQVLMLGIVDDRRRQHRRARQGDRGARSPRSRRSCRYGVELERVADQPTIVSESDLGIRALADGSARDRARGQPVEPRLAHRASWSGSRCRSCSASSPW